MGFTYLGIMLDANLNNLYKLNLASLLQKVEGDLCKWMDLTLDYGHGGLNLPNFRMYYWAAQSRFLAQRFENGPSPSWLNIETFEVDEG